MVDDLIGDQKQAPYRSELTYFLLISFQEFNMSKVAIFMTVMAGLGFTINLGAAIFLTNKIINNNSPFLR